MDVALVPAALESGPGPQTGLTSLRAVVPTPSTDSAYAQYLDALKRVGPPVLGALTLGPPVLALLGFAATGPIGALLAGASASLAGVWTVRAVSRNYNQRLHEELRSRLRDTGEFVGVSRLETNDKRTLAAAGRVDTDDNAGFLTVEPRRILVRLEHGKLEIPSDRVRSIELVAVAAHPTARYVRIEIETDAQEPQGFLIMARGDGTAKGSRAPTEKLHERLVEWHFDAQMEWLETQREGEWDRLLAASSESTPALENRAEEPKPT